jgi:hypothetical protein
VIGGEVALRVVRHGELEDVTVVPVELEL